MRRSGSITRGLAAMAIAAALMAGCGRPPDEAWLRFLGFQRTTTSGTSSTTSSVSVLSGKFNDRTTEEADAAFQNMSLTVGRDDQSGVGILIHRAHVEYSLNGAPAYDFPVMLYLAAPSKAGEPSSGTLSGFPIVPASLKQWINAPANFSARVTFYAEADDGTDLETSGGLSIELTE